MSDERDDPFYRAVERATSQRRRDEPARERDVVERLLVEAYTRGWNEGIETLLEDYPDAEAPHKDAFGEGCGTFLAEVEPRLRELLEAKALAEGEMEKVIGIFADALDVADNIIAINCGTDTPKEWDRAFRRCAKARQALLSIGGG